MYAGNDAGGVQPTCGREHGESLLTTKWQGYKPSRDNMPLWLEGLVRMTPRMHGDHQPERHDVHLVLFCEGEMLQRQALFFSE